MVSTVTRARVAASRVVRVAVIGGSFLRHHYCIPLYINCVGLDEKLVPIPPRHVDAQRVGINHPPPGLFGRVHQASPAPAAHRRDRHARLLCRLGRGENLLLVLLVVLDIAEFAVELVSARRHRLDELASYGPHTDDSRREDQDLPELGVMPVLVGVLALQLHQHRVGEVSARVGEVVDQGFLVTADRDAVAHVLDEVFAIAAPPFGFAAVPVVVAAVDAAAAVADGGAVPGGGTPVLWVEEGLGVAASGVDADHDGLLSASPIVYTTLHKLCSAVCEIFRENQKRPGLPTPTAPINP